MSGKKLYRLRLMGSFALTSPDGQRLAVRSRKSIALLALLATSENGERTRTWLQEKLWGTRDVAQAQASLRRELHSLRLLLSDIPLQLIGSDSKRVYLFLDNVAVDVRDSTLLAQSSSEFLEGYEITGEKGFASWLQSTRATIAGLLGQSPEEAPKPVNENNHATQQYGSILAFFPPSIADEEEPLCQRTRDRLEELFLNRFLASRWHQIVFVDDSAEGIAVFRNTAAIMRGLDAAYGLFSRITRTDAGVQVSCEMLGSPGLRRVWFKTLDLDASVVASDLDNELRKLSNGVIHVIEHEEIQSALACEDDALTLRQLLWRARHYLHGSVQDQVLAGQYLERAAALNPHVPETIILDCLQKIIRTVREDITPDGRSSLRDLAQRAMRADPNDARALLCAYQVEMFIGNLDLAIAHARRAVELNPSLIWVHEALGTAYLLNSDLPAALRSFQNALELSAHDWKEFHILANLALALTVAGRHAEAVDLCDRSMMVKTGFLLTPVVKVHALVQLSRFEEAAEVYHEHLGQEPRQWRLLIERMRFKDRLIQDSIRHSVELAASRASSERG